jgi:hypothetical protein
MDSHRDWQEIKGSGEVRPAAAEIRPDIFLHVYDKDES